MNKKSLWAASAAVAALTGLQAAQFFTSEMSMPIGIGLFFLSGVCLYQTISIGGKQTEVHDKDMLRRENELRTDIQGMASHQRDAWSDFVKRSDIEHEEIQNFSRDVLEKLEKGNTSIHHALLEFSAQSEKLNASNLNELNQSILEFSGHISSISSTFSEMSQGQYELFENFTGALGADLHNQMSNIMKSIADAMEDLTEAQEETATQISSLAMEYKEFEKLTKMSIEEMTTLSEKDFNLMKGIFHEDVS